MKTTTEQIDATTVKLTVEVEADRVRRAFDEAARHLAHDVQIKGFRRGKVPRRLLEARIGKAAIVQHAVEDHLSGFYAEAVRQEELVPVAPPEIDLQRFDEEEGAAFEAKVEVRPEFDLPDHTGIQVTFPEWEVTDDDVREELDALRERFAELDEVDRPAARGDYVTIDVAAFHDGEPIQRATVEDALYEVGSGGVTPKLDEELPGASAGHVLSYTDRLPEDYPEHGGEEVEFRVLVKDVRAKQLPPLDDDFAATASEFDTLAELEDDTRGRLRSRRLAHARQELRARVLEAYVALVDVPLPEGMVRAEVEGRIGSLERQAEQYGLALEQLLEIQGTDLESLRAQFEEAARQTVKAQLVLEALAEREQLTVESHEAEAEVVRHAQRHGIEPGELARVLAEQGQIGTLLGDVLRRKALDLIVDAAVVDGAPSEDTLRELGFGPGAAAAATAPVDPGAGTQPHEPSLGGEGAPVDAAEPVEEEEEAGETGEGDEG